ncbi:MAG: hypothetical protein ISQ13_00405 [Candidatus Margulisbacteria bacterium]|nr:hypothetical protein [Candidatus Margulisiibacteriota bacterium]
MAHIQFGTSGHRGIIGATFTIQHLVAISLAIANYLKKERKIKSPRILLGYDTRTGNSVHLEEGSYTHAVAQTLLSQGVAVDVCDTPTPTPAISWAVHAFSYNCGVILTASHNPPNYNGIKINDANGAPASPDMTQWIQTEANAMFEVATLNKKHTPLMKHVTKINVHNGFVDHLSHVLHNHFNLTFPSFSGTHIIDPKCGAAIDIWRIITQHASGTIQWKNDAPSADFNFELPDPTNQKNLSELKADCKASACVGFANDPDADRHVLVDENGNHVSPEKITAIVASYCIDNAIPVTSIASTLANSSLVRSICNLHGIDFKETKIGFKYFSQLLKQAKSQHKLCLAVESSGGFSVSFHTLDKCGFLPILLILAIMQKTKKSLAQCSAEIDAVHRPFFFVEDALPSSKITLNQLLDHQVSFDDIFGESVDGINKNDGLKITFSNSDWILCRPSGTEPLIRIYAESSSVEKAQHYVTQMKQHFC